MTISDCSERELIARIQARLPPPPDWLLVGIGDDAAVVEPERHRAEVLTVDALVEGVHFDRAFVPPDAIGHRALAVNLSDLAAMGAAPRLALLSLALPPGLLIADFDGLVAGIAALAERTRVHVVGGNLTRSTGPLMIDISLTGTVKPRQVLKRSGARPGDTLYVSGTIGAAAVGLMMLRNSTTHPKRSTTGDTKDTEEQSRSGNVLTSVSPVSSVVERCIQRYLRPEPRVRLGLMLARNRAASACMDLSDGLSDAVYQIAAASGVGARIDAGALPIEPCAREVFAARGADPVTEAITGGDDYELLVAVRPRTRGRLAAAIRHGGVPLTRIGVCTEDRAVVLSRDGGDTPLPGGGYSHFRSAEASSLDHARDDPARVEGSRAT
ncbi:MAG: thiamine-phosphate kinase [Acidobacteria bacterium 13_1_40CM_4_65_8]|nr:MAG: thiamine-phosphate kinase [Acidobacteria bacterium 13_1_40CM_4_65_8]